MARSWSLPEEFARLIESHTQLNKLTAGDCKDVGAISVALSSSLPAVSDPAWHERETFLAAFTKLAGTAKPADVLAQVDREFTEFAPVLKLAAPAKGLVQYLEEQPVKA
jgi:hypothetical protein